MAKNEGRFSNGHLSRHGGMMVQQTQVQNSNLLARQASNASKGNIDSLGAMTISSSPVYSA
jgi:hypothetical protein